MPYGRRYSRYRRRRTGRYKRRTAPKRVARKAPYRRSARAQSRQIKSLAKSLVSLRSKVKEDTVGLCRWQLNLQNMALDATNGSGIDVNRNIFVLPLTSASSSGTDAASSSFSDESIKDGTWTQVQPIVGDTRSASAGKNAPLWMKLHKQHTRMCFQANNMIRNCRFELFVIRLCRPGEGECQNDNTMNQIQAAIDGVDFTGCPNSSTRFLPGEDYYSSPGYIGPTPGTSTPFQTDLNGHTLVKMNNQRYKVEHHRKFVLGPTLKPVSSANAQTPSLVETNAAASTPDARDYYECSFTTNYGGCKILPYNEDPNLSNQSPINITDVKYADISNRIKRWVVIFPSRTLNSTDGQGIPIMSVLSNITTTVPV